MSASRPRLLILSSPSGAGKTTLAKMLLREFPDYEVSVSHTTRRPRPGEQDGVDYFFVDDAAFDHMVARGDFAEWAPVHRHRYGTSREEIDRILGQGKRILFDIDWQGTEQLRRAYPDAVGVFVLPPGMRELAARLRGRKTDDEEEIRVRLANARRELTHFDLYDHLVRNDDLEAAFRDVAAIVRGEAPARPPPGPEAVTHLIEEPA